MDQTEALEKLPYLIPEAGEEKELSSETACDQDVEKNCNNPAAIVGQHRSISAEMTFEGTNEGKESPVEESLQVYETRPTSEEMGLAEDWHPLGDSNPCSQTENLGARSANLLFS